MPRKAFHIGVDLEIHAVSCPGVWLCPRGDAMLQISMLGASAHTKRVEPNFPLLFHESFHFRKTLTGVSTLAELQTELSKRIVHLRLVQWQVHGCRCVLLAAFRSPLADLLYPQPASHGLVAGVDVDLLMETTPCFPGIIAPKIEVSTRVVIEDMINYPLHNHESAIVIHKTLPSKITTSKREIKPESKSKPRAKSALVGGLRMRQKPVCHTRPRVKCYSCKQRVTRPQKPRMQEDTHYIPYCNKCGDVVEDKKAIQGRIIVKENDEYTKKWDTTCPCLEPPRSKSVCDCNLCRKYYDLFKKPPQSSLLSQLPKSPRSKFDRSPSPVKRDSINGYIFNVDPYYGKQGQHLEDAPENTDKEPKNAEEIAEAELTTKVLTQLCHTLIKDPSNPPSGHHVYVDRYYNSPQLATELMKMNMF